MDRAQRLATFWNWLPAFRTVAETEHLPTAARLLHVSPSALSRSVKQLEDALGERLFVRVGRNLRLSPAGRELLPAVRDAMRALDDHVAHLHDERVAPERVRLAAPAPWVAVLVMPALAGHDAVIDHDEVAAADLVPRLLRGQLDAAITTEPPVDDRILIEALGEVEVAQVRARASRRSRRAGPETAPMFAVWTDGADGWPPDRPRPIGLASRRLDVVLDACASGRFVAVVPAVLARARGLRRMVQPGLRAHRLYLVRRRPLGTSRLDGLLVRVRDHARAWLAAAG